MVIYLKSPKNGTKVAMSEQEAQYDESNGWVRFDPSKLVHRGPVCEVQEIPNAKQEAPIVNLLREELTKQFVDKFGHKPHWKMSVDTIKEQLCQPPST